MTDQEYFERRKSLTDSISFDSDDDKPITRKDLKYFSEKIEDMFIKIQKSITEQIKDHKIECELCKGDYLMKNDCQDAWEKCYKIHKEDQAKLTDEKIKNINKYLELGKKAIWMLIPLFAYLTGKNADSLMKLFE